MKVIAWSSTMDPSCARSSGRNGGWMKRSQPESHGKRQLQMSPCPKCVGSRQRVRRYASSPRWSRRLTQRARSERCVCTTPLGCPVVPEVNRINASSSSRMPAAFPATGDPCAPSTAVRSTVSTPSRESTDHDSGSGLPFQIDSRGFAHAARVSISNGVKLVSMGTTHPPTRQAASSSTKNSLQLPKWMKTRSPRPNPCAW